MPTRRPIIIPPNVRVPLRTLGCPGQCGGSCSGQCRGRVSQALRRVTPNATGLPDIQSVPLRTKTIPLPAGDRGIALTILNMRRFVEQHPEGARNPEVRRAAIMATGGVDSRDYDGEIAAILQWIKSNVKFRGELGEQIQTPYVTLALKAGDCDCMTILACAMLRAIGYKVRFRTVAADSSAPGEFSHVYPEVLHKRTLEWIPLDATVTGSYPGWAPSKITRSRAWAEMGTLGTDPMIAAQQNPLPGVWWQNIAQTFATSIAPAVADRIRGPYAPYSEFGLAQAYPPPYAATSSSFLGLPTVVWVAGGIGVAALFLVSGRRR